MSTITGLDWDAWRSAYPTLTYAEQQAFHSAIYAEHPIQRHYDPTYVARAIEQVLPEDVVELGGWDGELAHTMLAQYPAIQAWDNVEICKEAVRHGDHCAAVLDMQDRYHAPILDDYYWAYAWTCDLFVASHVIEHLTLNHLNKAIEATEARALYMDAPLLDQPLNWQGFTGTHILEQGWTAVTRLCRNHGYTLAWSEDHETDTSSGDHARACLYLKDTA
jgi:hypothetical protein